MAEECESCGSEVDGIDVVFLTCECPCGCCWRGCSDCISDGRCADCADHEEDEE